MKELNGTNGRTEEGKRLQPQTPPHLIDLARQREIAAGTKYKAVSEALARAGVEMTKNARHLAEVSSFLDQAATLLSGE